MIPFLAPSGRCGSVDPAWAGGEQRRREDDAGEAEGERVVAPGRQQHAADRAARRRPEAEQGAGERHRRPRAGRRHFGQQRRQSDPGDAADNADQRLDGDGADRAERRGRDQREQQRLRDEERDDKAPRRQARQDAAGGYDALALGLSGVVLAAALLTAGSGRSNQPSTNRAATRSWRQARDRDGRRLVR